MLFIYLNFLPAYSHANKGNKSHNYSLVQSNVYSIEMGCLMKKMLSSSMFNLKAAVGIGAMIVFIAMVLIAGIAASVFVQTANKLEITGMDSGAQTTQEVSSGLRVVDIEGQKGNRKVDGTWYNDTIHNVTISFTPRPGSSDIDVSETVLEISNSTVKCILTYNSGEPEFVGSVPDSGVFSSTDGSTSIFEQSANTFGIIELEDPDGTCDADAPVINSGDMVLIAMNATACFNGLPGRTDVWGTLIPEQGSQALFSFRVPGIGGDIIYDLY